MRTILFLSIGLGLVSLAHAQPNDAVKKELAKFAGSWRLVAIEIDGKRNELQEANQTIYVLEGNKAYYLDKANKKVFWAELTIDPNTKPKLVDLMIKEKNQTWEGIYKVEGEDAAICANLVTDGAKERPSEFKTAEKFGFVIMHFRKIGK
jgi:uncharacterized protein (TIGR03067 family)